MIIFFIMLQIIIMKHSVEPVFARTHFMKKSTAVTFIIKNFWNKIKLISHRYVCVYLHFFYVYGNPRPHHILHHHSNPLHFEFPKNIIKNRGWRLPKMCCRDQCRHWPFPPSLLP